MLSLAARGVNPSVVNDQYGRLTFTSELASAIKHLLATKAPFGTYNVTGNGTVSSWADVAEKVFVLAGYDRRRVNRVSSEEYFANTSRPLAPRPTNSVLDLTKISNIGYVSCDSDQMLYEYVRGFTPPP